MSVEAKAHPLESGIRLPAGLRTIADGLDHPESLCWCPLAHCMYAGGEHGQVYRVAPGEGTAMLVVQIPDGFILGLATDGHGRIYACDIGNRRVWRIEPDGGAAPYGDEIAYPNYPVFGPDGRLYVSDSGTWKADDGAIHCIEPGGRTKRLETPPLRFPNGMALKDDRLYVVESTFPGVVRLPLGGGTPEVVVRLDRAIPDGIAFDAEGDLWVGCWQPNRILRLSAGGSLETIADDWTGIHVLTPNNLAFFGPGLEEVAFPALGGNFIRAFRPGVAGRSLHYPKVSP